MINILMICTVNYDRNGIAACIVNYCRYLNPNNYNVHVLASAGYSEALKDETESAGGTVISLCGRNKNPLKYFIFLEKLLRKNKYSIVHVHGNSRTMAIELAAARIAGCPVRIAHSHNTTCGHPKMNIALKPLFEWGCNGRFACHTDSGKWLFGRKSFHVIQNGVETDKYKYNSQKRVEIRNVLRISPDEILLGHVGIFNFQKNHDFLLEMFYALCQEKDNYKLICIGNGKYKTHIEEYILEHNLTDKVILTGNVDNVQDYLSAMDAFLLPSRYEGFPLALVEAQISGLPCFASENVTVEADILGNIFFLPLKKELWIEKVTQTLFSRHNPDGCMKLHDWEIGSTVDNMASIYKQLLTGESGK